MAYSATEKSSLAERDSNYFLELVVFQVEDRLFKVPKYYFVQKSDIFETMFSVPQPEGDLEGSNESKPLMLFGVNKGDFRRLLEVMYPLDTTKSLCGTMTQEGWTSVLKLAMMWNFKEIRVLAMGELTKHLVDPTEQILLARAYKVPEWLRAGYTALAERHKALSLEEAERIGYKVAVRLFHVRQRIRKNEPVETFGSIDEYFGVKYDASSAIEREFEVELREVDGT